MSQFKIKNKDKRRKVVLVLGDKGYSMSAYEAKQILDYISGKVEDHTLVALEKDNKIVGLNMVFKDKERLDAAIKTYQSDGYICYSKSN